MTKNEILKILEDEFDSIGELIVKLSEEIGALIGRRNQLHIAMQKIEDEISEEDKP